MLKLVRESEDDEAEMHMHLRPHLPQELDTIMPKDESKLNALSVRWVDSTEEHRIKNSKNCN